MGRLTRIELNVFEDAETGTRLAMPTDDLGAAEAMLDDILAEVASGRPTDDAAALEARKAERHGKVQRLVERHSAAGYLHDFGGETGAHVLQTRPDDRTNWLSLTARAQIAVGDGQGDDPFTVLRTADNANVVVTAAGALDAMTGMYDHLAAIMRRGWELKDAISAAAAMEAVEAVDITAGWPATPPA